MKDAHRGRAIQPRLPAEGNFNSPPAPEGGGLASVLVPKFKVWEWPGSSPGGLGLVSRMESPVLQASPETGPGMQQNWGGGGRGEATGITSHLET